MKIKTVINAKEVAASIDRVPEAIEADYSIAIKRCGLLVQRESMEVTPVDTGALKNSAYTKTEGNGFDTVVTVGYRQSYAIFVHETHPTQKKFLEKTYRRLLPEIRQTLIKAMKGN